MRLMLKAPIKHHAFKQFLLCCLFFVIATAAAPAARSADGSFDKEALAEIDRRLFLELVELAKFNAHFQLESNRHQKWRSVTYPLGREAGTALTFTGTIIDLTQLSQGLDSPARISKPTLKRAVACGITGNAISGGASALELAQNTWIMMQAKRKGFSPGRSLAFVKRIIASTDALLKTRESLVAAQPIEERRRVMELETKLVRRIRQQLVFEYSNWSCHSRYQAWRENTFYTLDSAQNFTRMSGAILAMKSFTNRQAARPAVLCGLVGNSVATVNPIVRNLAGIAIRKHQEKKLAKEIGNERPALLAEDLDELQQMLCTQSQGQEHGKWLQKVANLTNRSGLLDAQLDRETKQIERYRQIAQQQSVSGPLIGLTGVTSSTLATIAVFKYHDDFDTANKLGFAGRITHGTGQAYSLINTPYTAIRGILRNRELRSRGELPSQILQERLRKLDEIKSL